MKIPESTAQTIRSTVERYGLLEAGQRVAVAFSGGKDSIGLSLCLRELGYEVYPVSIDMGYEEGWGQRIVRLGKSINLDVHVVEVRSAAAGLIPGPEYKKIQLRLEVLNTISADKPGKLTPCTHCYNSKVIALDNAVRAADCSQVAFAHHLTDSCASLLKESLLRIDRHSRGHTRYDRANFEMLIDDLTKEAVEFSGKPGPVLAQIEQLVQSGQVDTDEPPRQPLRTDRAGVEIVRPLFSVWEEELTRLTSAAGVTPEGSGCGHGATLNTQTPREMVHHRILRDASPNFRDFLAGLVESSLTSEGHAPRRARYRRVEDLGEEYRTAPPVSDKL
ncbi:hypothetical protein ACIBKX_32765 [Streptomyces sp. NPDC050658]|uniref:hypothetical protein n=1 Tax=unclassified Streptomyces TaxID=2593676 RepID=UPI0034369765